MNGRCRPSTPSSERHAQWTWKFRSPTSDALPSVFENRTECPERSPDRALWIRIPTEIRPDTRKLAEMQIRMTNLSMTPGVHARHTRVRNRARAQTQRTMSGTTTDMLDPSNHRVHLHLLPPRPPNLPRHDRSLDHLVSKPGIQLETGNLGMAIIRPSRPGGKKKEKKKKEKKKKEIRRDKGTNLPSPPKGKGRIGLLLPSLPLL